MKRLAVFAVGVLAFAGCQGEPTGDTSVRQSELEKQVAGMYTPDDPDARVEATCSGCLDAQMDASQDCHLEIGDQAADVRAVVTSVAGNDIEFDATPFVPAARVAATIKRALVDQGFEVDSVDCADELFGVVHESVSCSAQPADGAGTVIATVASVDGLLVEFDYAVVG